MGNSSTTAADLRSRASYRGSSGTSYAYSAATASAPFSERKVHESLDPKRLNTLGWKGRECLDSPEHPLTIPVAVAFDETGSMGSGPRIIQDKLSTLKGITLRAGLPDAQLLFGAYGDAHNLEVAPCQVGQFESGLEMEEWLNNLYLEGKGGGNRHETAGLFLWFMANYTKLDSFDKRGKKGYIFLTGDETAGPVTRAEVKLYIDEDIEADLTMEQVVAQVTEKFDVYFLLVDNGSAKQQGSEAFWTKLLGATNVIIIEDLDNVSETISMILARAEGMIDSIDDGTDLLKAEGASDSAVAAVGRALAAYDAKVGTKAVVAQSSGTLTPGTMAAGDSERL